MTVSPGSDDTRLVLDVVLGSIAARWIAAALQLVILKAFIEPLAIWAGRSPYQWLDRLLNDRLPNLK
jgi:hypothetical protein